MEIRYLAVLEVQPEGGFMVEFPEVPGAMTEGDSIEDALLHAAEALSGVLESAIEHGYDIRPPGSGAESELCYFVAPDAKVQAALLIHFARGERSLADLACATETSWAAAKRLESGRAPESRQRGRHIR